MAGERINSTASASMVGRIWLITGRVQGVGFRPHVARLAARLSLAGSVTNTSAGVSVEAYGSAEQLDVFEHALVDEAPPAAKPRISNRRDLPGSPRPIGFSILASRSDVPATVGVTPDLSICPECLAELRDPTDARRGRYALINCTQCGPRYSIIRTIPYDRRTTTMAGFELCPTCRGEYQDPADRRFHAQPTACRACGPAVWLRTLEPDGEQTIQASDAIEAAARMLADGKILAVKGIGGYHLAVRADDEPAVVRLRDLKHRKLKPFAILARSIAVAEQLVVLTDAGRSLLKSPAAPIVLAERRARANVADAVAPHQRRLGVMLPYTPLHHLLLDLLPPSIESLVMTSANDSDEPLVYEDSEAVGRLAGLCDAILGHDRPIERSVDDSVILDRKTAAPAIIRRGRGLVPAAIPLPVASGEPGLCIGGDLKNAVAVVRKDEAIVSQHLGDLSNLRSIQAMQRAVDDMLRLFEVEPKWIAHDLHPGYCGTQIAGKLAEKWGVRRIEVQHHHAHAAAVLAEHGITGPAVAITCDGTGLGTDGTIWGGEVLVASLQRFERVGCLSPMRLPGGDAAAKQPWRCGLMLLHALGGDAAMDHPLAKRIAPSDAERSFVGRMLATGMACVWTSSTGRLFDGVAALLGLASTNAYESYAAQRLEAAAGACPAGAADVNLASIPPAAGLSLIDVRPLVRRVVNGVLAGERVESLAMGFHDALADGFARCAIAAARQHGLGDVVLGGGSMVNELFTQALRSRLTAAGLRVLESIDVPAGDGGLCYGQAAVAASAAGRPGGA